MIDFDYYKKVPKKWGVKYSKAKVQKIVTSYKEKLEEALKELNELRETRSFSPYMRDRRTPEEYIRDIIEGWLVEDLILQVWLTERLKELFPKKEYPNFKIVSTGADANRKIRFTAKSIRQNVTTEADFELEIQGKTKFIELQFSRKERGSYDMKEGKVKRAAKNNSLFLWYIQPSDTYFFVDPNWLMNNKEPKVNFLWGGKMTYEAKIEELDPNSMNNSFDKDIAKLLTK